MYSQLTIQGDRVTPFIMPRKGTKPYHQIWAEEDGVAAVDSHHKEKYPANQARGSLDQMDDDVAETDKVSTGPMLARLLSLMRHEQRPEASDNRNGTVNGEAATNGDGVDKDDATEPMPPATQLPGSDNSGWKNTSVPKVDYATADERVKQELRYIGFLGADEEPDYDAHEDDEVAQRLRILQAELREVMILNGARKARLLDIVEQHMAYQEYATIRDDLDNQVIAAYQKRTRTLGKGKKQAKRPGGAGGGSHPVAGQAGANVTRPGIGDAARTLLDRRRRWIETIGPIFSQEVTKVRGPGDNIFTDEQMAPYIAAERERLEEEEAAG
jgi:transcriptional adapter 3